MKTTRPGQASKLASPRLTAGLIAILLVFLGLGVAVAQRGALPVSLSRLYAPQTLHTLASIGLTDLFQSGWFICVLFLIAVNLIALAWTRLPGVLAAARQRTPTPVHWEKLSKARKGGDNPCAYVRFPVSIQREDFRQMVKVWAESRIDEAKVLKDEGGLTELQLAAQEGRTTEIFLHVAHFGVILVLLGAAMGSWSGFSGRIQIEERSESRQMELVSGRDQGWPQVREASNPVEGFFEPGFSLSMGGVTGPTTDKLSTLEFKREKKEPIAFMLQPGRPSKIEGLWLTQAKLDRTGVSGATVIVGDRQGLVADQEVRAEIGEVYPLQGAKFRILEVRDEIDGFGAAAEIEYTEAPVMIWKKLGDTPQEPRSERFWVFAGRPSYDPHHRKQSRYVFQVRSVDPKYRAQIEVLKHPGLIWIAVGALLAIISFALAFGVSHNRYYFVWMPQEIALVGVSSRPALFELRFGRLADLWRKRMSKLDRALKQQKTEVKRGLV